MRIPQGKKGMTCVKFRRCFLAWLLFPQWKSWLDLNMKSFFESCFFFAQPTNFPRNRARMLLPNCSNPCRLGSYPMVKWDPDLNVCAEKVWNGMYYVLNEVELTRMIYVYYILHIVSNCQQTKDTRGRRWHMFLHVGQGTHVGQSWICRWVLGGNHEHTRISAPERGAMLQKQGIVLPRFYRDFIYQVISPL